MNDLQNALLQLFENDAQLAQDLQNAVAYPLRERQALAVEHAKRLYPTRPAGRGYTPKTFWAVLANNRPLHVAFCGPQAKGDRIARYIVESMKWNGGKKPRASFAPYADLPQSWDGKEEKQTAYAPWDGRE